MEREGFEISDGSRRRISLRLVCTGGGPRRLLEYLFVVKSPLGAIEAALPSFSWEGGLFLGIWPRSGKKTLHISGYVCSCFFSSFPTM